MRWKEESLHIQVLRKLKIMGQPAHQDGAQLTQYAAGQAALGHYAICKYYQILAKCIQNAAEPHSMGPNPVMRSPPPAMRKPRENGEPMGLQGGLHERRAQSPGDEADVAADQTGNCPGQLVVFSPAVDVLPGSKEDNKPLARSLTRLSERVLGPINQDEPRAGTRRVKSSSVREDLKHPKWFSSSTFSLFNSGSRVLSMWSGSLPNACCLPCCLAGH